MSHPRFTTQFPAFAFTKVWGNSVGFLRGCGSFENGYNVSQALAALTDRILGVLVPMQIGDRITAIILSLLNGKRDLDNGQSGRYRV